MQSPFHKNPLAAHQADMCQRWFVGILLCCDKDNPLLWATNMPLHIAPAATRSALQCEAAKPFPLHKEIPNLPPGCAALPRQTVRQTFAAPVPVAVPPCWERHGKTNFAQCLPPLQSHRLWF